MFALIFTAIFMVTLSWDNLPRKGTIGVSPVERWDALGIDLKMSFVLFWSRLAVLGIETALWNKWLTRFAQQRWAASFFDSNNLAQRLLRSQRPSIFMTLPTHIPLFTVSVVLIIAGSVSRQNWMTTFGACLVVEPFVRFLFQLMVGRYSVAISNFMSTGAEVWLFRFKAFVLFSAAPIGIIIAGVTRNEPGFIWLGGLAFAFYPIILWLDLCKDFFRSPSVELWQQRVRAFGYFAFYPIIAIVTGIMQNRPGMIVGGGLVFALYPVILWHDLRKNFFRRQQGQAHDEDEMEYLRQFRPV
jgi:hypothetical protein